MGGRYRAPRLDWLGDKEPPLVINAHPEPNQRDSGWLRLAGFKPQWLFCTSKIICLIPCTLAFELSTATLTWYCGNMLSPSHATWQFSSRHELAPQVEACSRRGVVTVTVIGFPAVYTGRNLRNLVNSLSSNKEKAGYHAIPLCRENHTRKEASIKGTAALKRSMWVSHMAHAAERAV
jgi:hypothetical protein